MEQFRIVVLGSGAVGKSALTIRLVTQNFLVEYDPTIEDKFNKTMTVDGSPVTLEIVDTAGQDEYSTYQDQWMREGKGILLVYAIDSRNSFQAAQAFKEKIDRVKENEKVAIVLVGNKCDLESNRQVTRAQGEAIASQWKCKFFETSAKSKINNEECFAELVREVRRLDSVPKSSEKKRFWCNIL